MSHFIPQEFGLDNLILKPGEEILYSTWTITRVEDGVIVHYTEEDRVNKTSKLFTDVFELGKKYSIKMSIVTTRGPSVDTEPFIYTATDNKDIIDLYPIPAVVDTPIITMPYDVNNIPNTNIKFNVSSIIVSGNAVLESVDYWLVDDTNKVVWSSLKNKIDLTGIVLKDIVLSSDVAYTMYCSQKANNRDASGAGNITFKVTGLTELDIIGDIRDTFYSLGIDTGLKNTIKNMTKFEYELYGEDSVLLYRNENINGLITIPEVKPDNSDMLLEEDGYEYYTLRLKATTLSATYGWREYIFKPRKWLVESTIDNDTSKVYNNTFDQLQVEIEGFDSSSFDFNKYKGMQGTTLQLPDDTFILSYKYKKYGLYKYSEDKARFIKTKELNFDFIVDTSLNTSNSYYDVSYILPSGIVALIPLDTNVESYIYFLKYNPIKKEFTLLNKTTGGLALWLSKYIILIKVSINMFSYNVLTNEKISIFGDPFSDTSNRWFGVIDYTTRRKIKLYSHTKNNATTIDGRSVIVNIAEDFKSATLEPIVNEVLYPSSINPANSYFAYAKLKNNSTLIYTHEPVISNNTLSISYAVKGAGLNEYIKTAKQIDIKQDQPSINRLNRIFYFNNGNVLLMSLPSPQTSLMFT